MLGSCAVIIIQSLTKSKEQLSLVLQQSHQEKHVGLAPVLVAPTTYNTSIESTNSNSSIRNLETETERNSPTTDKLHQLQNYNVTTSPMSTGTTSTTIIKANNTAANSLPPIHTLITGTNRSDNTTGDVQFLLDFGVLGFAKAGTTTLQTLLCNHSQAICDIQEVRDLNQRKPTNFIARMYNLTSSSTIKRGYKCPNDIGQAHVMGYLRDYFSTTKIFIGIRHPVRWFESFYNFRTQNGSNMPHANTLIGGCYKGRGGVCTNRGLFHIMLARLNKTNMSAPEEVEMIQQYPKWFQENHSLPNPLFLVATEQLSDKNTTRLDILRRDIQDFVGFELEMPHVPHSKPGIQRDSAIQAKVDESKIDICDTEYKKLREALMDIARPASIWIRKYFIESESVVVSSKGYFTEILETWMYDPCEPLQSNGNGSVVASL